MSAGLSLYIFMPLSNHISLDRLVGISVKEDSYLNKSETSRRKFVKYNKDLVSIKKQLLWQMLIT